MLWGYIWVAGRFSKRHKRCIREEDNKSNKQVIAKLLIQMSLLVLYLVNAIIFSVIGMLREDPLSPGILDMFFRKYLYHVSLLLSEFIYLTFHQIFNNFNSIDPS
jgi:hypothetical protein